MKKTLLFSLLVVVLSLLAQQQSPAQRGDPLSPVQEVIASGASSNLSDGNVTISGTIGQAMIGVSTGKASTVHHGFWHPVQKTTAVSGNAIVDNTTRLSNAPNPFSNGTTISYQLLEQSHAQVRIYNLTGQLVNVLVNEVQSEGLREAFWDSKDQTGEEVAAGYYIYRLHTEPIEATSTSVDMSGVMLLVQ